MYCLLYKRNKKVICANDVLMRQALRAPVLLDASIWKRKTKHSDCKCVTCSSPPVKLQTRASGNIIPPCRILMVI